MKPCVAGAWPFEGRRNCYFVTDKVPFGGQNMVEEDGGVKPTTRSNPNELSQMILIYMGKILPSEPS
jgi:hypothetical protein